MKKLLSHFVVRKFERGTLYNDCQVRLLACTVLIRSNGLSEDPSDSVSLDNFPHPLAGYDSHLAPTALDRTRVNGQVFVRRLKSGPVKSSEFVLFG